MILIKVKNFFSKEVLFLSPNTPNRKWCVNILCGTREEENSSANGSNEKIYIEGRSDDELQKN